MFGTETFDLKPDIMTMAKAITSGYLPLSATVISEEIYRACVGQSEKLGVFAHGYTYTGHPAACAVALEVLDIYEERDLLGHVRRVGPMLQDGRAQARRPPAGRRGARRRARGRRGAGARQAGPRARSTRSARPARCSSPAPRPTA